MRNISFLCLQRVGLYVKVMPKSIDSYKIIFLHVTPVCIIVPQLIKYQIRTIFLEKLCTKRDGETIPRPFSKKSRFLEAYLWINNLKLYRIFFVCQVEGYRNRQYTNWTYQDILPPGIKSKKIFELYKIFMHNFCVEMSEYFQIRYCLQEALTHFCLEVSVYNIKSLCAKLL